MNKTTNKERLKFQAVIMTASIAILIVVSIFLNGCLKYWHTANAISQVEKQADNNAHYRQADDGNGYVWDSGWTDELVQRYNNNVNAKDELVRNSDIAQWCYTSGETITGKCIRLIAILQLTLLWCISMCLVVYVMYQDIIFLIHWKKQPRAKLKWVKL